MSDTKDKKTEKKTLSLGGTLSLKGGGAAPASKPSAPSGGGRKTVSVEVRRTRTSSSAATPSPQNQNPAGAGPSDIHNLTNEEREARLKAILEAEEAAKIKKEQDALKATEDAAKAETTAEETPATPELSDREKELAELTRIEEEEKLAREKEALMAQADMSVSPEDQEAKNRRAVTKADQAEEETFRERMKRNQQKQTRRAPTDRRKGGKITVTQALNKDYDRDRGMSMAAQRRAREKARMTAQAGPIETVKKIRDVIVPETITVQELANRMAERAADVIKSLMKMDIMANINQSIDADTAELIVEEFGHTIKRVTEADIEEGIEGPLDDDKDLKPRPPVVTIMGHVDHGKTSLLDALRSTDVVSGEAGGITQHIGAYQVSLEDDRKVTFLDTPGHAAFTEMRARGANVTDIVVLVVSASDSIMPQTIEAINHAKAAGVPLIVAVNKIDLPDANPQKVKTDLLQHEVVVEDMSGDVLCIEISALKRTNLDKLIEAIILQSELLELKANPDRDAVGAVVEAKMEQGRGNVATILVQNGTLRIGDFFVVGAEVGRVRAIIDDHGKQIKEAVPGQPVEVLGLNGSPNAGDTMVVLESEAKARDIAEYRVRKRLENKTAGAATFEELMTQAKAGEKEELAVLIKADVQGSVEAIVGSLKKIEEENDELAVTILHTGVGGITESDITLANASNALIIGFNVRANAQARDLAEKESVDMRYYNIIYNVIDDAKALLSGLLAPTIREEYLGQAEIREVFNITKVGKIAGCMIKTGVVKRGAGVRLLRDDVVIHEGTLKTLKRFKDEVKEVKEGTECGMAFEKYDDLKDGDVIECYQIVEEARTIE